MSLATRCTACGTIFRVVEDQLRVSEGWVRCGRCAEVFDAREQLFDIDQEAPPPWPPVPAPAALATPAMDLAMRDEHRPAPAMAVAKAAPEPDLNIRRAAPPAPIEGDFAAEPEHPRHELSDPGSPRMDFGAHESIVAAAMDSRHEPRWIDEPAPSASPAISAPDAAPPWTEPEIEQQIEQQIEQEVQEEMERMLAAQAAEQAQAKQRAEIAAEIESAMLAESERQAQLNRGAAAPSPTRSKTVEEDDHGFQATTLGAGGELLAEAEAAAQASSTSASAASAGAQATTSAELPEFLRPTRSHAFWGRLWVRLSLGLLCGLALVALAAQATWQFRDALVARYPQLRHDLQAFCELARCELKPWQRLESFSVDSSALSQAGSGHHYKLALSLRNKSEFELALPWVELSLTDASGQLIARRALAPKDFGLSKDSLAASSELPVNTLLTTGERAVSGYSVELFYP